MNIKKIMILLLMLCLGCSALAESDEEIFALLEGKTAGVMTGTPQDAIILAKLPDAEIQYFNSITDVALALEKKKIDFAALPSVNYYFLAQEYTSLGYFDVPFAVYDVGTVFAKNEESDVIREEMNEYIASLKESEAGRNAGILALSQRLGAD